MALSMHMQQTLRIEPSEQFIQFVEMCKKTRKELFKIFKKQDARYIREYNQKNATEYTAKDMYEMMVDDDRMLDSLLGGEGQAPEDYAKHGFTEHTEY